jgi:hypothetical protein
VCAAARHLTRFALQVQALAEFGDLPKNVDLIVLQQLPHDDHGARGDWASRLAAPA